MCFYDRTLAEELHQVFLDDAAGCERVSIERRKARGLWPRAQELVASIFQEQA